MSNNNNKKPSLKNPEDNPCWKGYEPVGTKTKDGKVVPNCVPVKENTAMQFRALFKTLDSLSESDKESKPDFLDLDGDGDTDEPMKKAAKEKKEKVDETVSGAFAEHYSTGLYGDTKDEVMKNVAQEYLDIDDLDEMGSVSVLIDQVKQALSDAFDAGRDNAVSEAKKMTPTREKEREKIVKGMKKSKSDLKKRYGKDWEDIMYATATKRAMDD